jgi:hypothetical protein
MSTTTAIAMIGDAHSYDGGVSAKHLLYLTENSRPSLQLFRLQTNAQEPRLGLVAIWTPTVENILEDLLLLIAAAASGDSALRQEILRSVAADELSKLCLYGIAEERRKELYGLLLKTKLSTKLVLTLLEGCTLLNQIDRLPQYDLDCELCISSRAAVGQLLGRE